MTPTRPPSPELQALFLDFERELDREKGLVGQMKALPSGARWASALAFALVVPGYALFFAPRPDLATHPALPFLGLTLLFGMALWVALWLALRSPERPAISGARLGSWLAPSALLALLVAALPEASATHAAAAGGGALGFWSSALSCFTSGLAWGLPIAALLAVLDRASTAPFELSLPSASAGLLVGALGLHLHCPIVDPAHLFAGHTGLLLPWIALAVLLRRRWRRKGTSRALPLYERP